MEEEVKTKAKDKKTSKVAKVLNIISIVILVLCAITLVYTTISYTKNGFVRFFSYSFHVIQTESMEPEIKVGDLVIVKSVPYSEIKVGDDILFRCEDKSSKVYGQLIVHRVVELTETEGVYITCGINNHGIKDKVPSKAEGKAVAVSSSLGSVFSFFSNWRNIIIVIAIGGLVIFTIIQVCVVIANASKYKEEKNKQKLVDNQELKEKLKQELLEEIKEEQATQVEQKEKEQEQLEKTEEAKEAQEKNKQDEDGGEDKWSTP